MSKKIIIICLFLLLCGCEKHDKSHSIETIIEQNDHYYMSVHYPITHISKIDKQVKKEVEQTIHNFKLEYPKHISLQGKSELNIDYTLSTLHPNYISIALYTFIHTPDLAHPTHMIDTITYDVKKKQIISLDSIISKEEWQRLLPSLKIKLIQQYQNCLFMNTLDATLQNQNLSTIPFILSNNMVTLYFPPYLLAPYSCGTLSLDIPFSMLHRNLVIEPEVSQNIFHYQPVNKSLDPNKPTVALTFDDGPSKYTKEILNILKGYDMNATFFILGNKVEVYQNLLKESLKNGNELGNHSYNHKCLTKLSKSEQQLQLTQTNEIVKQILNYDIKFFRPTYGAINDTLRKNSQMEVILWTVDTRDWKYKSGETIASKAIPTIKDGSIILMHDTHKQSVEGLKLILKYLKDKGYQVVTVSELRMIQKLRNEK